MLYQQVTVNERETNSKYACNGIMYQCGEKNGNKHMELLMEMN